MSAEEFEKSIRVLQSKQKNFSFGDLKKFCDLARIGHRDSRLVVKYGSILLKNYFSSVGTEVWDVVEQVFLASLDCGEFELANEYMSWLTKKFPGSLRVERLKGMQYEAQGNYEKAKKIYKNLLKKEPTDAFSMKRQISIESQIGGSKNANIALLNEYLTVYMTDLDAWGELANLYLKLKSYENAAFCYEELILADPQNYHYYVKYAEIHYTMGDLENYLIALKYYSYALELSKDKNLSALYGLVLTVHTISSIKQTALPKEALTAASWAQQQITTIYQKQNNQKNEVVSVCLEQLLPKGVFIQKKEKENEEFFPKKENDLTRTGPIAKLMQKKVSGGDQKDILQKGKGKKKKK